MRRWWRAVGGASRPYYARGEGGRGGEKERQRQRERWGSKQMLGLVVAVVGQEARNWEKAVHDICRCPWRHFITHLLGESSFFTGVPTRNALRVRAPTCPFLLLPPSSSLLLLLLLLLPSRSLLHRLFLSLFFSPSSSSRYALVRTTPFCFSPPPPPMHSFPGPVWVKEGRRGKGEG